MPLILERSHVLEIYKEASEHKWVIPAFNVENLTTLEAILEAVYSYGKEREIDNLPIIIGITNKYIPRPQSIFYTKTKKWYIGLKLFLKELEVLTSPDSPYYHLNVMVHLDHIQWDLDDELLKWDMKQFSSVMYDASTLPLEKNIENTSNFVKKHKNQILIEGACDEIVASTDVINNLTTPDQAEKYFNETGVDIIVANLGTEHRASSSVLKYEEELAREISKRIGPRLCLHGGSSLSEEQISHFFNDGIRKVNIWTILERESTPVLFNVMVENAAKVIGYEKAKKMNEAALIGESTDLYSNASIDYYTTAFRNEIIFNQMKRIINKYITLLYV